MREIKFRGFCDGEWVYGYLYHDQRFMGGNPCEDVMIIRDDGDQDYIVKEESIGEFTGLHDKNGKEVYEGDIIINEYSPGRPVKEFVSWDDKETGFNPFTQKLCDGDTYNPPSNRVEVIGNIYENPELCSYSK